MVESSSVYTPTTKYIITAKFEVEGVVEKPDVVGAIFGQTEGLFGPDLDLRELQKSNRIGRIEITLRSERDKTFGSIKIPSSLDKASTAIIAAAIESIDRIGPCAAKITLEKIEDLREEKRKKILEKAKEILKNWVLESSPSSEEIIREVSNVIKASEVCSIGPEGLPAGPEALEASSIIIVEGRADVINLLKCGIKNVVGIEGTKIPQTIIDLCKNKEAIAFLDGDRGGDLILKELLQVADIDYVARAPPGKEVEELTPKEIMKQLREKIPVEQLKLENHILVKPTLPKEILETIKELKGTLEAVFFDEEGKTLARMPVGELAEKIKDISNAYYLVFDGIITQRILDLAEAKEIKVIIGDRISELAKIPVNIKVLTFSNLNQA
ncbi:MAG: DNA primase DnaG [Candidatus Bathyarchaeia archaeon]